jgi:hypothetical protein
VKISLPPPNGNIAEPGLEPGEGGHAIGRNPHDMTVAELRQLGHQPATLPGAEAASAVNGKPKSGRPATSLPRSDLDEKFYTPRARP